MHRHFPNPKETPLAGALKERLAKLEAIYSEKFIC